MKTGKVKICDNCGNSYEPTGRCQKYCSDCKRPMDLKRLRDRPKQLTGHGKGGNQKGERNHQWKGGTSGFRQVKLESLKGEYYCERCGKDLRKVINGIKNGLWAVHHKDHNRNNPALGNLELLCKKCHQIEHECWLNFSNKG